MFSSKLGQIFQESVEYAITEVQQATMDECIAFVENWAECQCGEHWTGRDLHAPDCLWNELQYIAKALREVKDKIGN